MNAEEIDVVVEERLIVEDPSGPAEGEGGLRWPRVLIGVTTILAIAAVFTVGVRTQVLDTDEWVGLSSELLENSDVQDSLAVYLVDSVYAELDVPAALGEALPEDLEGLAPTLAGIVRGPLIDAVRALLASDLFQSLWAEANRTAHSTFVDILRDNTGELTSTAGGTVTLELKPLVESVGETLGLPDSFLEDLPDDAGQVVIFESDELDLVQQAVKILDFLAWFLFALVVALYALAVYIAKGRRMRALRSVGWSLAAVGVVVLAARTLAVKALVDAIVEDPGGGTTAQAVGDIGTALLRQMGWAALTYGVLLVLFTSLMGDRRWATSVRRAIAPALNASPGAVIAGTVVLLLLVFWWSPGRALESWITGLTLIGLIVGAVVAMRRKTQQEFPDVTWDTVMDSLPWARPTTEVVMEEISVEEVSVEEAVESLDTPGIT